MFQDVEFGDVVKKTWQFGHGLAYTVHLVIPMLRVHHVRTVEGQYFRNNRSTGADLGKMSEIKNTITLDFFL